MVMTWVYQISRLDYVCRMSSFLGTKDLDPEFKGVPTKSGTRSRFTTLESVLVGVKRVLFVHLWSTPYTLMASTEELCLVDSLNGGGVDVLEKASGGGE